MTRGIMTAYARRATANRDIDFGRRLSFALTDLAPGQRATRIVIRRRFAAIVLTAKHITLARFENMFTGTVSITH